MNWLDILLLSLLAISVVTAFRKGFTREVIGLASVVAALLLGIWFYGTAGGFLVPYVSSRAIANLCGFFIVFGGIMLAGGLAGLVFGKLLQAAGLSFFDRLLGAGFGVLRGAVLAVALITAIMAFRPAGAPPDSVVHSRVAPYVVDASRMVSAIAPYELKHGFLRTYGEVKSAWKDAWKKGIREIPDIRKAVHEREI